LQPILTNFKTNVDCLEINEKYNEPNA